MAHISWDVKARARDGQLVPANDVARRLGISSSRLLALVADRDSNFPAPYILSPSPRARRFFRLDEVDTWLETRREHR